MGDAHFRMSLIGYKDFGTTKQEFTLEFNDQVERLHHKKCKAV